MIQVRRACWTTVKARSGRVTTRLRHPASWQTRHTRNIHDTETRGGAVLRRDPMMIRPSVKVRSKKAQQVELPSGIAWKAYQASGSVFSRQDRLTNEFGVPRTSLLNGAGNVGVGSRVVSEPQA